MGPVAEALVVVALGLEELAEVRLAVDVVVQRGVVRQTGGGTKDVIRNVDEVRKCFYPHAIRLLNAQEESADDQVVVFTLTVMSFMHLLCYIISKTSVLSFSK